MPTAVGVPKITPFVEHVPALLQETGEVVIPKPGGKALITWNVLMFSTLHLASDPIPEAVILGCG